MINDILNDIKSSKIKKIILDTDAANEIDDQFAISYAALSPKIELLSANSALHDDGYGHESGVIRSYDEILRTLSVAVPNEKIPVYKGARKPMSDPSFPVGSAAADNIINTVLSSDERVYVVAIGAITNVVSAILKAPEIVNNMVVVWLGGNSHDRGSIHEFNFHQDPVAGLTLFDLDVPLVQIPAMGLTSDLITSIHELRYYLKGKNPLCDFLLDRCEAYPSIQEYCASKVLWDIAAIACLAIPEAFEFTVTPKPMVTSDGKYVFDSKRPPYICARRLDRDKIFAEVFGLITGDSK